MSRGAVGKNASDIKGWLRTSRRGEGKVNRLTQQTLRTVTTAIMLALALNGCTPKPEEQVVRSPNGNVDLVHERRDREVKATFAFRNETADFFIEQGVDCRDRSPTPIPAASPTTNWQACGAKPIAGKSVSPARTPSSTGFTR
jgi:hypothetical protein